MALNSVSKSPGRAVAVSDGHYARSAAGALAALAREQVRVHCITNGVAMSYTANMLLAAGAIPSMSTDAAEIADFVIGADSLSVNLGTLDSSRKEAIAIALKKARRVAKPWVLDPVLIDVSPARRRYARELADAGPCVIRANAREIEALAGAADDAPGRLAVRTGAIVVQSGAVDLVTDGQRHVQVANGSPLMARVTAMGCAACALIAAFLAVSRDPLAGCVEACMVLGVAGERAATTAAGPGSFQARILDELYLLDEATLLARGCIE